MAKYIRVLAKLTPNCETFMRIDLSKVSLVSEVYPKMTKQGDPAFAFSIVVDGIIIESQNYFDKDLAIEQHYAFITCVPFLNL